MLNEAEIHHLALLINSLFAVAAAGVNFSYFMFHPNGKKWIRFMASLALMHFGIVQWKAFWFEIDPATHGVEYLRLFFPILYSISVWDVIFDWKTKPKELDERAYLYKIISFGKFIYSKLNIFSPTSKKKHLKKKQKRQNTSSMKSALL